jgi:NTE family protein
MRKRICVALQGGGAHGAFTWGALDRLLEEPSLELEAVSGTSAGALNGAVLVDALKRGGRSLARERLEHFWSRVSAVGNGIFKPGRRLGPPLNANTDWSPAAIWSDMVTLVWSPYDNWFYENLLADLIAEVLPDFGVLNDARKPYLFICATNVKTNHRKIFGAGNDKLGVAALAASACLPTLFRAVEIDGHAYWDGGFLGNPALMPLRSLDLPSDVLIIWVNPLHQPKLPTNARAIQDRMNEITFNAALVQEIETIDAVNELKRTAATASPYKRIHLHELSDERYMATLGYASKTNTDWSFLTELRDAGRRAAERWLATNLEGVGARTTADVPALLRCLASPAPEPHLESTP